MAVGTGVSDVVGGGDHCDSRGDKGAFVSAAGVDVGTAPMEKEDTAVAGCGCAGGGCTEMVKRTDEVPTIRNIF